MNDATSHAIRERGYDARAVAGGSSPGMLSAVASLEIAGRSDDIFYDARRGRIYVLASGGFLEVFRQKDPDHYELIGHYATPPGTQTGLFVPEWGKLFAAVRRKDDQDAEVRVYVAN